MSFKKCKGKCERELPATEEFFYRNRKWLTGKCKKCFNDQCVEQALIKRIRRRLKC